MEDIKLSSRQRAIYNFVLQQVNEKGYPPSVREIADAVGLSSASTVHAHLSTLEEKGLLVRDPNRPRALTITTKDATDDSNSTITTHDDSICTLPLVGNVAAGSPILAEQNIEDYYPVPQSLVGDSNSFILKVRGESMIEAGILDGDYIIVKEQATAWNGQIVVALIEDEATVKTFYKEEQRIRLQPENSTMEPIYATDVKILGVVVGLYRTI